MKVLTFNYTKADGKTSERTLAATVVPGDKYAGIDITELDPSELNSFMKDMQNIHQVYLDMLKGVQAKYDLKHNYRQFFANKMTDIEEISAVALV